MKKTAFLAAIAAGLCFSMTSFAQVPASAPTGTTGLCKDGTFYSGASKKGACAGHKGVKTWYGAASATAASGAMASGAMAAPVAASAAKPAAASGAMTKSAAPGGGPGQVWANTSTKVYHCSTDKYYGKTKQGSYMSEADAKAKGFHPAHGKACS
ncbi:hypothetical protein Bsp3421_001442 [Burkholderia sp. FERM BP-3421]|jgi:hypothetical protein|uniref:hypothetical protein n=1 Tax=Burkholderia sp. FERM BP-3421 TaxID=1494466 RepID=UPI00235EA89F|nr:hypothetical protein [Burkholderia sp. FERM BP-3421]WDD91515.1 hypothetical protein Bsp3421_001442 [Burkholderia sp. FERM BP-3421]